MSPAGEALPTQTSKYSPLPLESPANTTLLSVENQLRPSVYPPYPPSVARVPFTFPGTPAPKSTRTSTTPNRSVIFLPYVIRPLVPTPPSLGKQGVSGWTAAIPLGECRPLNIFPLQNETLRPSSHSAPTDHHQRKHLPRLFHTDPKRNNLGPRELRPTVLSPREPLTHNLPPSSSHSEGFNGSHLPTYNWTHSMPALTLRAAL